MQALVIALAATASALAPARRATSLKTPTKATAVADAPTAVPDRVSKENPLRVVIAGAGVGGLTLANALDDCDHVDVTLVEKTSAFKRFGGPIQLASNAMQLFKEMDRELYDEIESKFTWTGNLTNGIKDGLRDEWYAKFDLATPAAKRSMPFTGVIERPDLQEILLDGLAEGVVSNGLGIKSYGRECSAAGSEADCPVVVRLDDDVTEVPGDVLQGAVLSPFSIRIGTPDHLAAGGVAATPTGQSSMLHTSPEAGRSGLRQVSSASGINFPPLQVTDWM